MPITLSQTFSHRARANWRLQPVNSGNALTFALICASNDGSVFVKANAGA